MDAHEIDKLTNLVDALQGQNSTRLGHGLDDEDARHDRRTREMPGEKWLIDGDILQRLDADPQFHFQDPVDQQ